jgi:hypothetical protein
MGAVPALDELVEVPGGRYELGEPGAERVCTIKRKILGLNLARLHGMDVPG